MVTEKQGEVNERHVVSILEGMEHAGFKITTMDWIDDYDHDLKELTQNLLEQFVRKTKTTFKA